jgi:asparagine synthase (glutamine-hydrolysing)
MCGIAGTYNWGDRATVVGMSDLQAHRGPDDSGVWCERLPDGNVMGLGSRRLSILDLSAAGHMPMPSPNGKLWIAYNGEVYNFRELRAELEARGETFRSNSDTEVVLRLYQRDGPESVARLDGMFALAIWDLRQDPPTLFLARDHFGVKPLYYIQSQGRLAFASEAKAFAALPGFSPEVDLQFLPQYLTFLWVPEPATIMRGVRKLPAGHYATLRQGELRIQQYWDLRLPSANAGFAKSEAELVEGVRHHLGRAVQSQMVSDVPLGAFLSAGIDSTSIVAMMRKATTGPVRTWTITYPTKHRIGENTLDDPAVAREVAERFCCEHHQIEVEPNVAELLPTLAYHMDEPVADPAILAAYLVCREARKSVTVLLSGIGGDEVFAGYAKHRAAIWARSYRRMPGFGRKLLEGAVAGLPGMRGTRLKGLVRLAKKMARSGSLPPQDAFLMNCTYFSGEMIAGLCTPSTTEAFTGENPWQRHRAYFDNVSEADFVNQMLYLDVKTFMVSLNLNYNDKMSMASSTEVRVPFLDRELVEYVAAQVPPLLKLHGWPRPTTKYILRKAMEGVLPPAVLHQPKAGFGAPVDYWLARELRDMVEELLSERQLRERGFFQPATVRRMIQEHRDGARDWSMHIWQLLTFELWMRAFIGGGTAPERREVQCAG